MPSPSAGSGLLRPLCPSLSHRLQLTKSSTNGDASTVHMVVRGAFKILFAPVGFRPGTDISRWFIPYSQERVWSEAKTVSPVASMAGCLISHHPCRLAVRSKWTLQTKGFLRSHGKLRLGALHCNRIWVAPSCSRASKTGSSAACRIV